MITSVVTATVLALLGIAAVVPLVIIVSILAGIWIVIGQAICLPLFTSTVADMYMW